MSKIVILHLSDLHFAANKKRDIAIVLEALFADIRSQITTGLRPDLIIFTGDLVQSGSVYTDFEDAANTFIAPLLKVCGLGKDRFFIAPGNHDISRDTVRELDYIESGLAQKLNNVSSTNNFIDNAEKQGPALDRLNNFISFTRTNNWGSPVLKTPFVDAASLSINGTLVGIACLNSSWRATGEGPKEKGRLLLGERAVDNAIEAVSASDLRIAAFHHPLEWLQEFDQISVENRLFSGFDLLLFGHNHRASPEQRTTALSSAVLAQSGALYETREHFNGYQFVTVDTDMRAVDLTIRSYINTPRRAFDAALNVAPQGTCQFSLKKNSAATDYQQIEHALRTLRPLVRTLACKQLALANADDDIFDLNDRFICPPLGKYQEFQISKISDENAVTDAHVLTSKDNFYIFGRRESGKTSLAHYLSVRTCEGIYDRPRIPVVIDLGLLRVGDAMIRRAIKTYYVDNDSPIDFSTHISSGNMLFLVDNVDFRDEKKNQLYTSFLQKIGRNKCIFFCEEYIITDDKGKIDKLIDDSATKLHILSLPRQSIRELSRKFSNGDDSGKSFDLVMAHINRANLPKTGYIVSLLLWAIQKKCQIEHVNEAALLENILEFLLEKADFTGALRKEFDYRGKELLLQHIAEKMKNSDGFIAENSMLNIVIEFFRGRGLDYGAVEVIQKFIDCGVLSVRGGMVSFRYRCFQEFFVAGRIRCDANLFNTVLDGRNFIEYARELELLAGIDRQNDTLLDKMADKVRAYFPDIMNSSDISPLEELGHTDAAIDISTERLADIKDTKLTPAQIDDLLDLADRRSAQFREIERNELPKQSDGESNAEAPFSDNLSDIMAYGIAVETYGRIIKNSEYTSADNKKSHITLFIDEWSKIIEYYIKSVHDAVHDARENIDRFKEIDSGRLEKAEYMLKVAIPVMMGSVISDQIGNEKLLPIISDIFLNCDDFASRVIAGFILIDLKAESSDRMWLQFLKQKRGNKYLMRLALEKMWMHYKTRVLTDNERIRLENIIADIEITLRGIDKRGKPYVISDIRKKRDIRIDFD